MKVPAAILLVLWLVPSWSTEPRVPLWGESPDLVATPVALDSANPARTRLGALDYLGGWQLTSHDKAFGGISAMLVEPAPGGDRLTLLSDYALITRFRMTPTGSIAEARFATLPMWSDIGWAKPSVDTESIAQDPATRQAWVGVEGPNAIVRFSANLTRQQRMRRPRAMRGWSDNGGPESLARMPDGGFVVISETSRWGRAPRRGSPRAALRFAGDPTDSGAFRFSYMPPKGYDPSDAVALPDGRLLVINRRFRLPYVFTAVLTLVDSRAIRPGKIVRGRVIARFEGSVLHDNLEALAVTREGNDTILWIASDDNQMPLQRTLLLKFRLR